MSESCNVRPYHRQSFDAFLNFGRVKLVAISKESRTANALSKLVPYQPLYLHDKHILYKKVLLILKLSIVHSKLAIKKKHLK